MLSKLLWHDNCTWDLRERGNEASSAGGALHPGAALSWNWKLQLLCHGVSPLSWSEKAISQQQQQLLNHQVDHRHLHCQHHFHHVWCFGRGVNIPEQTNTYLMKRLPESCEAQQLSGQCWSQKVCKRRRVGSGRKACQRGRHCLFSILMPVSYKNLSRIDSLSESITSLQFNGWLLHPFHSSLSFPWINSDYTMIGFFLEKLSLFIIRTSPRHRIALQYYFWLSYPSFVAFALWIKICCRPTQHDSHALQTFALHDGRFARLYFHQCQRRGLVWLPIAMHTYLPNCRFPVPFVCTTFCVEVYFQIKR